MSRPEISIVLGSYNRLAFLKAVIGSIRDNGITVAYETIVVDGGSTDGSMQWLARQKDIITIIQHNRGEFRGKPIGRRSWGYFMNLAFKCTHGKYVLMISDDSLLVPGAAMSGLRHVETLRSLGRDVGAGAFYWRNWPDEREYKVGLTLGGKMFVNHGIYLRRALEDVGWIDEERYRFYHADGDLCLKLWERGYEVVDCPDAFVEHFTHANLSARRSNAERQRADWAAYLSKWTGVFYDPEKQDTGDKISRRHEDPHETVRRFPRKAVTAFRVRRRLGSLKSALDKVMPEFLRVWRSGR